MSKVLRRCCALIAAVTFGVVLVSSPAEAKKHGHHHHHQHEKTITFEGDFTFAGAHLAFQGDSLPPRYGFAGVEGDTDFVPSASSPLCFTIASDLVVLTAFDGSELYLENSGEDCLDFSTGVPTFVGSGTTLILGGTGRYCHAEGDGTYAVEAVADTLGPSGAEGAFTLTFTLDIDD